MGHWTPKRSTTTQSRWALRHLPQILSESLTAANPAIWPEDKPHSRLQEPLLLNKFCKFDAALSIGHNPWPNRYQRHCRISDTRLHELALHVTIFWHHNSDLHVIDVDDNLRPSRRAVIDWLRVLYDGLRSIQTMILSFHRQCGVIGLVLKTCERRNVLKEDEQI